MWLCVFACVRVFCVPCVCDSVSLCVWLRVLVWACIGVCVLACVLVCVCVMCVFV